MQQYTERFIVIGNVSPFIQKNGAAQLLTSQHPEREDLHFAVGLAENDCGQAVNCRCLAIP